MIHIPVLRWGEPYKSLEADKVVHFSTGEVLAEVSRANGGLIERDMRGAKDLVLTEAGRTVYDYARRFANLTGELHDALAELRELVRAVPVPQSVASRVVQLCRASRPEDKRASRFVKDYVSWGAGPRGSQNLVLAAKARALLLGRTAPTVEDIAAVALPVLRHRISPNHRAVGDRITTDQIIERLVAET